MANGANKKIMSERLEKVYQMIIDGYSPGKIKRECTEEFGISTRQVETYMKKVNKEITENHQKNIKNLQAQANIRYLDQYRKMDKIGDHRGAVLAHKQMDKINGIDSIKIEIDTSEEIKKEMDVFSGLLGLDQEGNDNK